VLTDANIKLTILDPEAKAATRTRPAKGAKPPVTEKEAAPPAAKNATPGKT
jgi:hypothetical protein